MTSSENAKPVARVGHQTITDSEIQDTLRNYPASYRENLISPAAQKNFLSSVINQKVTYQLATENGLFRDPEFIRRLTSQKESLLMSFYYDKRRKELNITDDYVIQKYPLIVGPQMEVAFSRMIFSSSSKAQRALTLLKSGKPFTGVARALDLPVGTKSFTKPDQIEAEIKIPLYRLKDGEVSDLLKTKRGYELIRRDQSRPYTPTSKELENWRRTVIAAQMQSDINEAKSKMTIDIDEAALAAAIQGVKP